MSFQEQRIEILQDRIGELQAELEMLTGDIKPFEFRVVYAAERYYQLPNIKQKTRSKRYVQARAAVAHILRKKEYSFPEIGDALGVDHTTAIHAVKNISVSDSDKKRILAMVQS